MITRPTVLVLGAGASQPFGFPTARQLLLGICHELKQGSSPLRDALVGFHHYSEGDVEQFRRALLLSNQPSVDAFLERRQEFLSLGKAAIAAALIPYEREEGLHREGRLRWYEYLWQKLTPADADAFGDNQITVVTFNYDRSLEHFLYLSLRYSYKLQEREAAELLRRVPIIHLYGKLGQLPYLGDDARSYDPEVRAGSLARWANAIRIVTEEVPDDDPSFSQAWGALVRAKVVCFLGFGYHEENVQRLRVRELLSARPERRQRHCQVYGSAYGMKDGDKLAVSRMFPGEISLGYPIEDALDMLRGWPILG